MLPADLAHLFNTFDSDELNSRVERAVYEEEVVLITFNVWPAGKEGQRQRWTVRSINLRKFLLHQPYALEMQLLDEHPYLWSFNEMRASLFIKRRAQDPNALFVAISGILRKITGTFEPVDSALNQGMDLEQLCRLDNGLFAEGPVPLLKAYQKVLEAAGCGPYIFGEEEPKRWDGSQWASTKGNSKVLLFGNSWIIADGFNWERLSSTPG